MSKKVMRNSITGLFLYASRVLSTFAITPIIINTLGNREYGFWEVLMSVIGYMGLLDLGIGGAIVRFVSVAEGENNETKLQEIISTTFAFFILMGIVAAIIFCVLAQMPGFVLGSDISKIYNFNSIFYLLAVNSIFYFPSQVFIATIMGFQRHHLVNNIRMALGIVQAVLIYWLLSLYNNSGLLVLSVLTVIFTILELIVFSANFFNDSRIPSLCISAVTIRTLKELARFAVKGSFLMIANRLQSQSIPIIISHVIGMSQIPYFTMPNRLIEYGKGISLSLGLPLTPYFGSFVGKNEKSELGKAWVNSSFAILILTLASPILIFLYGSDFLRLWIGTEFAEKGKYLLYILTLGLIADLVAFSSIHILIANNEHGRCSVIWLFLSMVNIIVSVMGCIIWGLEGVAIGTTLVVTTGNYITLKIACKKMQIPIKYFLRRTLVRILPVMIIMTVCFKLIRDLISIDSFKILFLHLFLYGIIYLVYTWVIILNREERKYIISQVKIGIARVNIKSTLAE